MSLAEVDASLFRNAICGWGDGIGAMYAQPNVSEGKECKKNRSCSIIL